MLALVVAIFLAALPARVLPSSVAILAPPPTCIHVLTKDCTAARGVSVAACDACTHSIGTVLRKAGCTPAVELAWCRGTAPPAPPGPPRPPGPPAAHCLHVLTKGCTAAKGVSVTACDACTHTLQAVLRNAGCTLAVELAWCNGTLPPAPSPPPPPPPPAPPPRPPDPALAGRAFLTHATQKVERNSLFRPNVTHGTFGVAAARNEYEAFLVVLNGPLSNVSIEGLELPPTAKGMIESRVYRVAYVSVVNVSDCDSPGPGLYPDALIPAVDEYVNETRNALPVSVPARQTRALWIDLFVPPGTLPGTHEGGQLKLSVLQQDGSTRVLALRFSVTVYAHTLPSISSMQSLYNTPAGGIFDGHNPNRSVVGFQSPPGAS